MSKGCAILVYMVIREAKAEDRLARDVADLERGGERRRDPNLGFCENQSANTLRVDATSPPGRTIVAVDAAAVAGGCPGDSRPLSRL